MAEVDKSATSTDETDWRKDCKKPELDDRVKTEVFTEGYFSIPVITFIGCHSD